MLRMKNLQVVRLQVPFFCLLVWLSIPSTRLNAQNKASKVLITQFGGKGDGSADNSSALTQAINSADTIVFPKGIYLLSSMVSFKNLNNKTILAYGATITNADNTKGILRFELCNNINIAGGTWTRKNMPEEQGKAGNEHTFTFANIKSLSIHKVTIDGSPQMGICMINVIGAKITENVIKNCFRDGIYSHYSVKLLYEDNYLENIKDDAMSIHDYGLEIQKTFIAKAGFKQAGYSIVKDNTVKNCYQGFSSIGCDNLTITGNQISNTVNAGICIFNSENLFKGSTATVKNVTITGNTLNEDGAPTSIMGKEYKDYGQLSSGRAALYVAVNDAKNFILHPQSRISNITIENNQITNSHVNGVYLAQIDHLIFTGNTIKHYDLDVSAYCKAATEVVNCSDVSNNANTVTK